MTGESLRQDLFVAGAVSTLNHGVAASRDLVLEKVLQAAYARNPQLDPNQAASGIQALQSAFDSLPASHTAAIAQETSDQQIVSVLNAMEQAPVTGDVASALQDVATEAIQGTQTSEGLSSSGLFTSSDQLPTLLTGDFNPAGVLQQAVSLASSNTSFGTAWNQLWSSPTGENIDSSVQQLVSSAPGLQGGLAKSITGLIQNGTLNTTEGTLTADSSGSPGFDAFQQVDTTTVDAQNTAANLQDGSETSTQAQQDAAGYSSTLDDASGAVSLLSSVVGTVDPQVGRDIAAFGNAAIDIANAFSEWSDTAETALDVVSSISDIGSSVLTGNVVQGVMSLVSMFGGGSQNADSLILDKLGKLQTDLHNFAKATAQNFQKVDQEISAVYSNLSTQLTTIQNEVAAGNRQLSTIEDGLAQLQDQLDQVEEQLYNAIVDTTWNSHADDIQTALKLKQFGAPLSYDQFATDALNFYGWATGDSFASPNVQPAPAGLPLPVGTDLTQLDQDMNIFRVLPQLESWQAGPLAPQNLPNPRDWELTSRAFSELLLQYPQYVNRDAQTKAQYQGLLNALHSEGVAFESAIADISSLDDPSPPAPGIENSVLNGAANSYLSAATALTNTLSSAESAYVNASQVTVPDQPKPDGTAKQLNWPSGVTIWPTQNGGWQGADQSVSADGNAYPTAPATQIATGCGTNQGIAGVVKQLPAAFLLASRLGLGTLSNTCSAAWVNTKESSHRCGGQLNPGIVVDDAGQDQVTISWTFKSNAYGNVNAGTVTWTDPNAVTYSVSDDCNPNNDTDVSAMSWALGEWSTVASGLAATQGVPDQTGLTTVRQDVTNNGFGTERAGLLSWLTSSWNGDLSTGGQHFGNGVLEKEQADLDQAATLLRDYVTIGLAPALAHDDALHAALYGDSNHRLIDGHYILNTYNAAANASPAPSTDPLYDVGVGPRATLLFNLLKTYVQGNAGTALLAEGTPLIEATVSRLSLVSTIVNQQPLNPTYRLSIFSSGTGSGTVASSPAGISCSGSCSASFPGGTTVTLTATPANGSTFAGWSGGPCSGTGACTITMDSDLGVTANFIRPGGGTGGGVASGTAGSGTLSVGGITVHGRTVSVSLTCSGPGGSRCQATLELTATEVQRRGKVIAVYATRHQLKTVRRPLHLGSAIADLAAGQTRSIEITLNGVGKKLLRREHHLAVQLGVSMTGTSTIVRGVSFRLPVTHKKPHRHG